jgi:hypothetical protein
MAAAKGWLVLHLSVCIFFYLFDNHLFQQVSDEDRNPLKTVLVGAREAAILVILSINQTESANFI